MELQDSSATLQSARVLFDGVLRPYLELESLSGSKEKIVESVSFECVVVKIQLKAVSHMTKAKLRTISHLLKPEHADKADIAVRTSSSTKSSLGAKKMPQKYVEERTTLLAFI